MAYYKPPHQDLPCLQSQLFLPLVVIELISEILERFKTEKIASLIDLVKLAILTYETLKTCFTSNFEMELFPIFQYLYLACTAFLKAKSAFRLKSMIAYHAYHIYSDTRHFPLSKTTPKVKIWAVVQSILSLTSSLRGQLVKCFTTL